ncbi:MAG: C25 family cysteine peptidase, partial [Candidatus Cloacimonadota bacterium]|nr:C25 family cysteine peptidase [Candidatus Cloacimonadota bacterium]
MKKTLSIIAISLYFAVSLFAVNQNINLEQSSQEINIIENSDTKFEVILNFSEIKSSEIETEKGNFNILEIPKAYYVGDVGEPKLPAVKKLIEIPFDADVSIEVQDFSVMEYSLSDYFINNAIVPQQPSIPKNVDPATVEFEFNQSKYSQNNFIQHPLAKVEILGTMRGIRLARLVVCPVQYNPVQGKIKVYNHIRVEVNFSGSNIAKAENIRAATASPYFLPLYKSIFNHRDYPDHPDLTTYPVKYLIISDPMFEDALQPLVEWKTQKGFTVIEAYTVEIGTSYNQIKTYIHELYNSGTPEDPAPSFVLFVGDTGQVPSTNGTQTSKDTDLYYCSVDGDYFPEMYYGRFSATTVAQVESQVEKTIYYEKYQFENPNFLDNITLIAGEDVSHNPSHGRPTILYGAENYFNEEHGFDNIHIFLTSYTGCFNPTIDDGICMINYTAHGSQTSWAGPQMTQGMVNDLTNVGKYPLAIGNCCLSGDFGYPECFGETWARATDNTTGEPTGSIGYIASAPSSYWDEDVYWAVGAFPTVGNGQVPPIAETTWGAYDAGFITDYVTQDALNFCGNLAVTEADNQGFPGYAGAEYYWQAYNLLGDPSVVVYMTQGEINNVSYMDVLPIGVNSFIVNANSGSYVGISMNGELHGSALADENGVAEVVFDQIFVQAGLADIIVTKPQYQPYIGQVQVAPLEGPFVIVDNFFVTSGDDDIIEFGEDATMDVSLKNVGVEMVLGLNMELFIEDDYITLTDDEEFIGDIDSSEVVTFEDAFAFSVANDVPDDYSFTFDAVMTDVNDSTWNAQLNLTAYAPIVSIGSVAVNDGDNNRLDPGDVADLNVILQNSGGAKVHNIEAILSYISGDDNITINEDTGNLDTILAGDSGIVTFNVTVSDDAQIGDLAEFQINISADNEYATIQEFSLNIGLVIESFETGDFSAFPWEFGGSADWTISTDAYEGEYSAQSGVISHNQITSLSITFDVLADGEISFWKKVSSETNYDYLKFFIDDTEFGSWA